MWEIDWTDEFGRWILSDEVDAAAREVREELGIEMMLEGPVYRDSNQFWHQGEMQDNVDFLFRAECGREEPRLLGFTTDEMEIMKEIRWWSAAERWVCGEPIWWN